MTSALRTRLRRRLRDAYYFIRPLWYIASPRYRRPSEPVPLHELISPLRFDILIRAEMFDFLGGIPRAERTDHVTVAHRARALRYWTWYREVAAPLELGHGATESEIASGFEDRLRGAIRLLDRFERVGFDRRRPIKLAHHERLETATGKRLDRRLQPDDGCHRLALLWRSGVAAVPVDACWVFARHGPAIDNTSILLRHGSIDLNEYYRFIGLGYTSTSVDGRDALLEAVGDERGANVLAEVLHILAIDEPTSARHS